MEREKSGHRLAAQTDWCGCVSALAATCAAFQAVARQPDAARLRLRSSLKGATAGRKGESSCSQARLGEEETKDRELGQGLRGTRVHRTWEDIGSPFFEGPEVVRCLGPTYGLLEQIKLFLHLQVHSSPIPDVELDCLAIV